MTLFMFSCKHLHSISNLSEWPEGMITFIENHTEYNRLFGATTMLMCHLVKTSFTSLVDITDTRSELRTTALEA